MVRPGFVTPHHGAYSISAGTIARAGLHIQHSGPIDVPTRSVVQGLLSSKTVCSRFENRWRINVDRASGKSVTTLAQQNTGLIV